MQVEESVHDEFKNSSAALPYKLQRHHVTSPTRTYCFH